jgi:hypothetical protein
VKSFCGFLGLLMGNCDYACCLVCQFLASFDYCSKPVVELAASLEIVCS